MNVGTINGKFKKELLDVCLIKWGKIGKIGNPKPEIRNSKLEVKVVVDNYQPLENKGGKFYLGGLQRREIIWNKLLIPKLKIGDWVSIHWGYVIERLSKEDLANLKKYTKVNISALS